MILRKNLLYFFCALSVFLTSADCLSGQSKPAKARKKVIKTLYGTASFYSNKFNGRKTASGQIFKQDKLTCACNVLPIGTLIKVTNVRNGKTVLVKVNDRLHPKMKRLVDLTRAAAQKLGFIAKGVARVKVEVQ